MTTTEHEMRAAFYTAEGPASEVLQLGEQPTPVPNRGEVRVRLRTSGVNPSDVKSRAGGFGRPMAAPLVVPHSDGAGDIDAVGEGVPAERVGERVWIWNGQWRRAFGTAAQYIALPSEQAVVLPEKIDYPAGACLGIPALTAYQAVRLLGLERGATVLVSGGAGAVAHYAIQIAKARGLRVLATVSSAEKAAHASAAGADEIINYKTETVAERVRSLTDGRGVEGIVEVDLSANAALLPDVLRPHGTVSIYGMSANETMLNTRWMLRSTATLRFFLVYDLDARDRAEAIGGISELMREGRLHHAVFRKLPLDRIAEAHELVESGRAMGNVVLEIG